ALVGRARRARPRGRRAHLQSPARRLPEFRAGQLQRRQPSRFEVDHPGADICKQAITETDAMNEDAFNASIRKFLKTLGVTGQREIEKAVRQALADGRIKDDARLPASATITIAGVGLSWKVEGEIELA